VWCGSRCGRWWQWYGDVVSESDGVEDSSCPHHHRFLRIVLLQRVRYLITVAAIPAWSSCPAVCYGRKRGRQQDELFRVARTSALSQKRVAVQQIASMVLFRGEARRWRCQMEGRSPPASSR